MLVINNAVRIPLDEINLSAIRAQGAGGKNVNKVSSAIHLQFNVVESSLPDDLKQSVLKLRDHRITKEGVIVIKAQRFRTQESNREDALKRLKALIVSASFKPKPRRPTAPTRSSQRKRMDKKTQRGQLKQLRSKLTD